MKIILINLSQVIGGQEIYLLQMERLLRKKYNMEIFCDKEIWTKNLKIHNNTKLINNERFGYSDFFKMKKFIKKNFDNEGVMIFNGNRAIYLGSLLPNKYKKIAIQHSSLVDVQDGRIKRLLRFLAYKFLVKRYDRLIGVSQNSINLIAKSKNVHVVHNGVDVENFYPVNLEGKNKLRNKYGFSINDKIILMVGTLTENKGQLEALNVIKELDESYKLILVGTGPEKKRIEQEIVENNIDNKVILCGQVNDVEKYYKLSDTLLFLSENEGLPLTILEAMATGLPILTTNVGGIPEVVEENINGFFINRNTPHKTALLIKKLFEDTETLKVISNNNIKKINREFTLNHCANKLIQHIEQVANGND